MTQYFKLLAEDYLSLIKGKVYPHNKIIDDIGNNVSYYVEKYPNDWEDVTPKINISAEVDTIFSQLENNNHHLDWLAYATRFELGNCPIHDRPIIIEARDQLDGSRKWVLKMHEWVLGKDSEFHWEPRPSSRSDKFIENTRFNSLSECHSFWVKNINEAKKLTVK